MNTTKIKIDLHCHSKYSDGLSSISAIEEKSLNTGILVTVTDHNEIRGSVELFERNQVITLPAIEVGTKEGIEFLLYFNSIPEIERFYTNLIEPFRVSRFMVRMNLTIEKLLCELEDYECYTSIAHPFGIGKKSINKLRKNKHLLDLISSKINGVEILNGNTSSKSNRKAKGYFNSLEAKTLTAGSDGHYLNSICSVYSEFDVKTTLTESRQLYSLLFNTERKAIQDKFINMLYTGLIIGYEHTKYFIKNGKSL